MPRHLALPGPLDLVLAILVAALVLPSMAHAAEPVVLSGTEQGSDPALVVALEGNATVAWSSYPFSCVDVRFARVAPDGTATAPETFPGAGTCPHDPDLAIGPDNTVTAVWNADGAIQMSRIGLDGVPSPAQTIGSGDEQTSPQIETDRSGRSVVVYRGPGVGKNYGKRSYRARAVMIAADGSAGTETDLSKFDVTQPVLGTDGRGRVTVAWSTGDFNGTEAFHIVQARNVLPNGPLGPLRTLSESGETGRSVAVDVSGSHATVAWNNDGRVLARRMSASGKLSAKPLILSRSKKRQAFDPQVLATGLAAIVVWATQKGNGFRVVSSGLSANGRALPARTVAEDARGPALVPDGSGGAVLGYVGTDTGSFLTQLRLGRAPRNASPLFPDSYSVSGLQLATDGAGQTTAVGLVSDESAIGTIELVRP